MIESKFKSGRHIVLPAINPIYAATPGMNNFTAQTPVPLYLDQSRKEDGHKISDTAGVDGDKDHRRFQWLGWNPGFVSHVPMNGRDVLTGPMSGCDLVLFNVGGIMHAGHIGTDMDPARTAQAKTAWNTWVGANAAQFVGRFNPFRALNRFPSAKGDDSVGQVFGLYTTAGRFYTIFAFQQKANPNERRIARVRRVRSTIHPANV